MNTSDFAQQYETLSDDEILRLWAERDALVPEAVVAIESEVERRGLKKQNAVRVKKRFDRLAARQGPLREQVTAAKYERNMRHFIGWEEPEFYSSYSSRDIRGTFAYIRYKYRVWKSFRDHTGSWPVLSMTFYFLYWIPVFILGNSLNNWLGERKVHDYRSDAAVICAIVVSLILQHLGAKLMRKLDWKRCSSSRAI